MDDIRWVQRFSNYVRAMQTLRAAVDLAEQRSLSELEKQAVTQERDKRGLQQRAD